MGGKCNKGAGKVNVLTWGDLLSSCQSKSGRDDRVRQQESAEAMVPHWVRERLNIGMPKA